MKQGNVNSWPPDYLDRPPAPGDLPDLEVERTRRRGESYAEARRRLAWRRYHDAHGWPDGPLYCHKCGEPLGSNYENCSMCFDFHYHVTTDEGRG